MKVKEAAFVQRLGALFIDFLLIGCIVSLFSSAFVKTDDQEKLVKEANQAITDLQEKKIDAKTYVNREMDISYDLARKTALTSLISVAVYILYFIVFQYKNNGQTIGKKLLKIKVVSNDDKDLSINNFAYRALLVNNILVDIVILSIIIMGTKNIYMIGTMIVEPLRYILLFVIAVMVLFRKDKRGLHDLVANTKVIREV